MGADSRAIGHNGTRFLGRALPAEYQPFIRRSQIIIA
jgi:hypothetical protein